MQTQPCIRPGRVADALALLRGEHLPSRRRVCAAALVRQALEEFRARRPEGLAPSRAAEVARIDPRMPKLRAWLDEVDRRDEAA